MDVILLEKIRNLGDLGELVKVKAGYARNYLLPYGKAVLASKENQAKLEAHRAELEKAETEVLTRARARGEKMDGATVQIVAKVGEEGKLFGSVSNRDIAEAMTAAGFEIARSEIQLSKGPIKEVGDHEIIVSLHPEVTAKIIVSVVGESQKS